MRIVTTLFLATLPLRIGFTQDLATTSPAQEYLRGWVTPDSLYRACPEFQPITGAYHPDEQALQLLRCYNEPVTILIFFGGWCSDSKREVPRFLAISNLIANKNFSVQLFGLDRSKKDSAGFAEAFGITHVPTFIFWRGNRDFLANGHAFKAQTQDELGRITEAPAASIEQDWVNILKHNSAWAQKMEWERQLALWLLSVALSAIH